MNDVDDDIKGGGDAVVELQPEMSSSDADDLIKSVSSTALKQKEDESLGQPKNNDVKKENVAAPLTKESLNTVRLLGEPLVTHGPYTFYSALGYRQRDDVIIKSRQRWKKRQSQVTVGNNENVTVVESYDSSSSCCCSGDDAGNDVCSCDDGSLLTSKQSDWSVIQMNHFYAVRPWYSKKNSSTGDRLQQQQHNHRKNSPKLTKSTEAEQPQQHHHQQSVCIGELELLWRDDSVITSTTMSSTSSLSSSSLKKRSDTKPLTEASNGGDEIDTITSSHHGIATASSDDDDGDCGENYDGPTALLPRRRLPRRTRQPSAKKLEAAESYAAVVAASAHEHQPTQQGPYRRNQISATAATSLNPTFTSGVSSSLIDAQYKHGNLLCSVRLYVMPDQTAPGRLGGVHGEDEVLEINTWGASGGIDRWQNNVYMNSGSGIGSSYNGGSGGIDDYGYGSGSHSSGTLPSSCSGLVLRAEDFVEWVRGGLMNGDDDDDENENTDSEHDSMKSECVDDSFNDQKMIKTELPEQKNEQQQISPLRTNTKGEIKIENLEICHDDETNKIKLESTVTSGVTKKELPNLDELKIKQELSSEISIDLDKEKTEQEAVTATNSGGEDEKLIQNKFDNHCYSKSTVDDAIKVESIPLAAAKIHKRHRRRHHCLHSKSLVNGSDTSITVRKHNHCQHKLKMTTNKEDHKYTNNQVCYCYCCKRRRNNQTNDKKRNTSGGINKQQLVVMSYSRYCRYRAQLQRKREEQLNERDIAVVTNGDGEKYAVPTYQGVDTINTPRVLFCRDTYDYPAELLLEPFNTQQCQQQNTSSVLVNHLAPKLKGWPAYPSSWMSFRWNRVRRHLRHIERGSGNDDNRRRRRRRKLKKKCRQNEASGGMGVMNYSSSSEDDDSDNSDSDDVSSATNDATTNTTTTASTSDSDGAIPPPSVVIAKTVNKNHSSTIPKVNGGIHHNNKKNHSIMANNMITINGVNTSISATTINKRPAMTIQQSGQQNPMKRRRMVYTQGSSQHQNQSQQRIIYQQQQQNLISRQTQQQQYRSRQSDQLNQHMLVVQQHQQRLHTFNQRLSTSSPLQAPSSRIIHHHLPPSVSIMPVIMSNSNIATQQQRFKQNRQKQHVSAGVQRQNNNNDRQQTLLPVIIEYDKTQEHGSNDNGRYKKSTVTYHRRIERHDFKGDQSQQREDDRQRRWLVDALRLGGLEVTAVPLNVDTGRGNNNSCSDGKNIVSTVTATLQQQQHRRQRGISFESLSSTTNKHIHNGDVGKNEPSPGSGADDNSTTNSNFNSEIMTITPDVLSMLDKSEHKHQLVQKTLHHNRTSLDRPSTSMTLAGTAQPQQQRRRSINIQSNSNNSSSQQPHSSKTAVAAAALHDKIYRAIDSLKQQQKQQNLNTSTSINNRGNNVIIMSGINYHQSNSDNNYRQQQRRLKNDGVTDGIRQQQQTLVTPALLDLTVKSLTVPNTTTNIRQQKTLSLSPTINPQQQQQRKIKSPFHSTATSDAANLEITIVPVTAATSVNSTRFLSQQQHQQKHSPSTALHENSTGGSEVTSSLSLMTVRQQLQQRNVSSVTSSTASLSYLDMLCGGKNHRQQRNVTATSTSTTTITTSQEQPQQQQILLSSASSAGAPAPNQQQNIKRKPQ